MRVALHLDVDEHRVQPVAADCLSNGSSGELMQFWFWFAKNFPGQQLGRAPDAERAASQPDPPGGA